MSPISPVSRLYIALVHHPVLGRQAETIASAVTNLDLHDIARAAKTYGAAGYFVVTPLEDQKRLVKRIIAHWTDGSGARYNPLRAEAFELMRVCDSLADAAVLVSADTGKAPLVAATTARLYPGAVTMEYLKDRLNTSPVLLVFGTAWGLAPLVLERADCVLEPLAGKSAYNHLSVRSAVSIMLDRLAEDRV
ncbi:MAG: RNA methyltransferase [Thermodesulfobacteriota bacterium]|nr:RNA methyltransferase [Thermodesulfobacteriota bacterium]